MALIALVVASGGQGQLGPGHRLSQCLCVKGNSTLESTESDETRGTTISETPQPPLSPPPRCGTPSLIRGQVRFMGMWDGAQDAPEV